MKVHNQKGGENNMINTSICFLVVFGFAVVALACMFYADMDCDMQMVFKELSLYFFFLLLFLILLVSILWEVLKNG